MHGGGLGPGALTIIAWWIFIRSIREEKSLGKTNAHNLNQMLFSVGVFMHSKQIFSKLSKFSGYDSSLYLLRLNPLHIIYITVYCWENRGVILGVVSFGCLDVDSSVWQGIWHWRGAWDSAKHSEHVHASHTLLCASYKPFRRKSQEVGRTHR